MSNRGNSKDPFAPNLHRKQPISRKTAYLCARLLADHRMFNELSLEHEIYCERERGEAVKALIRSQWELPWKHKGGLSLYREREIPGSENSDFDHVIPVSWMADNWVVPTLPDKGCECALIRAWLAPIALISTKSHRNVTEDVPDENLPFLRYSAAHTRNGKPVEIIRHDGTPVPLESWTIKQHWDYLEGCWTWTKEILNDYGVRRPSEATSRGDLGVASQTATSSPLLHERPMAVTDGGQESATA